MATDKLDPVDVIGSPEDYSDQQLVDALLAVHGYSVEEAVADAEDIRAAR